MGCVAHKKYRANFAACPILFGVVIFDPYKHYLSNTLKQSQLQIGKLAFISHLHLFTASKLHARVWIHIV
jgi:hypothetical protein